MTDLRDLIRTIPDYPKPGILFRDITTLLADAGGFRRVIASFTERYAGQRIDKVAGIEARGFILGGALAERLRTLPGREAIVARVRDNARRAAGLGVVEHHRARIPCALLTAEGLCAVYEVRPLACRAHTSTSLSVCARVFAGAASASEVPGEGWLRLAAAAIREGLGEGPGEELHTALAGAL